MTTTSKMPRPQRRLYVPDAVAKKMGRWPEAEFVAQPVRVKELKAPRVLVRRRTADLEGPRGEQLIALDGLPTIELFAGIGGFSLGMEAAGFVTLCQHELDPDACATLIANRPRYFRNAALIQGDIQTTPTSMILAEAGLRVGECEVVCGGPPCQGFSTAGRRRPEDERNSLIFAFLDKVREIQPHFFVMENVPGLLTLDKGRFFKEFLHRAYGSYYELVYGLVECSEYWVPQMRCRFICMGTRRDIFECDGILGSLPAPVCFAEPDLAMIHRLSGPLFEGELSLLTHPPGIRYFPDREVLVPPRPVSGGRRSDKFVAFYRRLRAEEPDRIVTGPKGDA